MTRISPDKKTYESQNKNSTFQEFVPDNETKVKKNLHTPITPYRKNETARRTHKTKTIYTKNVVPNKKYAACTIHNSEKRHLTKHTIVNKSKPSSNGTQS